MSIRKVTWVETAYYAIGIRVSRDLIIVHRMSIALALTMRIILFVSQVIQGKCFVRMVSFCFILPAAWTIIRHGFIIIRPIFLIYMLGITSCGGNVAYPDCSFCPLDNTTNGIKGCDGNCQINPHNRLCEEKSKLTHKMTFKL